MLYEYPLITEKQKQELIKLDELLKIEPYNIDALQRKGFIITDCEEFLDAEKVYKKILNIDPKNYMAFLWLIINTWTLGDIYQLKDVALKALEAYPEDAAFHMFLAEAYSDLIRYFSSDDTDNFFYHIQKAIELEPTWLRPRIDLIEFLTSIKKYERAKLEIEAAYKQIQDNFPKPKNDVDEYFESFITRRLDSDFNRDALNELLIEIENPKSSRKYILMKTIEKKTKKYFNEKNNKNE